MEKKVLDDEFLDKITGGITENMSRAENPGSDTTKKADELLDHCKRQRNTTGGIAGIGIQLPDDWDKEDVTAVFLGSD